MSANAEGRPRQGGPRMSQQDGVDNGIVRPGTDSCEPDALLDVRRGAYGDVQLVEGRQLRDDGATAADRDEWWRRTCDQGIRALAASGAEFTADDLRRLGVPEPASPGAFGSRFLAAARAGVIRKVGYRQSERTERRASVSAVWRGAVQ